MSLLTQMLQIRHKDRKTVPTKTYTSQRAAVIQQTSHALIESFYITISHWNRHHTYC